MTELPLFALVDPDEQATQLRGHLKSLKANISEECEGLDKDALDLVENCTVLGSLTSEAEVEMVLNSIMSLVLIVPANEGKAEQVVRRFCEKLELSAKESPHLGGAFIRVLSNLFYGYGGRDMADRRYLQFVIYCALLKVAELSGLVHMIPTKLSTLNTWFVEWELTMDQKRECLRTLHNALLQSHLPEASTQAMLELLGTYTEADAASAQTDARECIRTAIADPGTFIFDHLLSLSPVKQLSGEMIYSLLQVFVSGSFSDYQTFYRQNSSFVDGLPLTHEANLYKMRVLTLMSLGEDRSQVPFDELAKVLELPKGEQLEEFIISAVQTRMIRAKIDQMSDQLLIAGVRHRTFGRPQWELLRQRLGVWTANLNQLRVSIDSLNL